MSVVKEFLHSLKVVGGVFIIGLAVAVFIELPFLFMLYIDFINTPFDKFIVAITLFFWWLMIITCIHFLREINEKKA